MAKRKNSFWMKLGVCLCVLSMLIMPSFAENAVESYEMTTNGKIYYLAPNGNDSNVGSFAYPFATLEKAMNTMDPGDILYVRGGEYHAAGTGSGVKNKNGSADKWFTVLNYPGEQPIFNGDWGINGGAGFGIWFVNSSYWHVEGLEICEYQETGVFIDSSSSHIELVNMSFHDITDYTDPDCPYGRSGITAYSDECVVEGCEFYNIGTNRAYGDMTDHGIYIVNTGKNWKIRNNYFHDIPAGGGVHIYGGGTGDKSGSLIENNLFVRTYLGVVLGTAGCYNTEVRNNTFWNGTSCDIFLTEGTHDNNIHHNIFGPLAPDPAGLLGNHIKVPQLWCLYNTIDYNFYDDSADSSSVYPVLIENYVAAGNTFTQKVTWDAWTAEAEDGVVYEEKYDGATEAIPGFGMEAHGQTGAVKYTDPANGDFTLGSNTECTISGIGMADGKWTAVAKKTADPILVLKNYGFESSSTTLDDWYVSDWGTPIQWAISTDEAYSGKHSLKITQAFKDGYAQNGMVETKRSNDEGLPIVAGHIYQISVKIKNSLKDGAFMLYDGLHGAVLATDKNADGKWKTVTATYTPKDGDTKMRIQLLFQGNGVCYVDDFNVSDMSTVPDGSKVVNLFSNADFENGTTGWTYSNWSVDKSEDRAPVMNADSTVYHGGVNSLHIKNNYDDNVCLAIQGVGLKGNTTYTLRAYVKTGAARADDAIAGFFVSEVVGSDYGRRDFVGNRVTGVSKEWTMIEGEFTTAAGTNAAEFCLYLNGAGEAWFDDVLLAEGSHSIGSGDTDASDTSMVGNYSFESELSGNWDYQRDWAEKGTSKIERVTAEHVTGDYSIHIHNAAGDKSSVGDNWRTNVESNTTYKLTAKVKTSTETAVDANMYLVIDECNSNSQHDGFDRYRIVSQTLTGAVSDWTELSATFTTAESAARVCVCIFAEGEGDFYVDDVVMTKVGSGLKMDSMIPNPSFESGMSGGWKVDDYASELNQKGEYELTQSEKKSGHSSLHIKHTLNVEANAAQASCANTDFTIPVEGGKTYTIRTYVKTGASNNADAFAAYFIRESNGSAYTVNDFAGTKVIGARTEWTPITVEYTTREDTTALYVGLYFRGYGEAWFDDVEMKESVTIESLVSNPGFENGLTGWQHFNWSDESSNTVTYGLVQDAAKNGMQSLHLAHDHARQTNGVLANVDAKGNTTYRVSAYVKTGANNSDDAFAAFYIREKKDGKYTDKNFFADFDNAKIKGVNQEWTLVKGVFTTSQDVTGFDLHLYFNGYGEAWFDDVVVVEVEENLASTKNTCTGKLRELAKKKADYDTDEQAKLEKLTDEAIKLIEEAETVAEVQAIYDSVVVKIDDLPTKAEKEAAAKELLVAKEAAKEQIDEMADPEDYRDGVKPEVEKLISAAKRLVDAAEDEERIEEVVQLLDKMLKKMKTDAELTAEELKAAKETAKNALQEAGKNTDASGAIDIIQKGISAIDAAEDQAGVAAALAEALNQLAALKERRLSIAVAVVSGEVFKLPFADIDAEDWFYEAVEYVYENKLMNGVGKSRFAPNEDTTRGMVVTILARMEGEDTDSGATWYENGRLWAMKNDISDGTHMEEKVTREQLVTILYRYARYKGMKLDAADSLSAFSDVSSISTYAKPAMQWAVATGLIAGRGNGQLAPQGTATRAELATILMRFAAMK